MKSFKQLAIAQKLTLSTVSLMACSLIFMTCLVYFSIVTFGDNFLKQELLERTKIVERSVTEPLWNYDHIQLEEVGHSMLVDSKYVYLSALKIENDKNEVLFEKDINHKKTNFHFHSDKPFTQTNIVSIYRDGQLIGTASLAVTNEGFIKIIRTQLFYVLTLSLSLLFLVSMMLRFYFKKLLTNPLNQILHQIRQLDEKKHYSMEYKNLPPELVVIARSLDEAWLQIKKRNDDVLCYADDLENLVMARTQELESQITKNLNAARLVAAGEMAAGVAHEINNPLTIIDLHICKLKKMYVDPEVPINYHDFMNSIEKVQAMVSRIVKIIKGLKALARDGHSDPMQCFSIHNMIEEVKVLVDMKIKGQDILFKTEICQEELEVLGREVQISQVLVNLINNSVDAISGRKEKWITLSVKSENNFVQFILTDSGEGISSDLQENIMRPFFTTKDSQRGTGLGLSISKNIIEEHGGVFYYNKTSLHTQFIFTLQKADILKMSA